MGDEFLFQELAESNIGTLEQYQVKKIVTHCPHCLNSFKNDYPQMGGQFEVQHHSQFLAELIDQKRLPSLRENPGEDGARLTYHDPCYLARVQGETDTPRRLLGLYNRSQGDQSLVEMGRSGRQTACCGAGGGRMWFDDPSDQRIGSGRIEEVLETGADTLAVSCPFCLTMMGDGIAARNAKVEVKDIAELLIEALDMNNPNEPVG